MNEAQSSRRLETMRAFVEQQPDQAFPRYGLAMEYVKLERFEEAVAEFRRLATQHPDYLATYYQLGSVLIRVGRRDEAREALQQGIVVSTAQGKLHAKSELEEALTALGSC